MPNSSDVDTAEFAAYGSSVGSKPPQSSNVEVEVAAASHTGKVRSNNEDHYLVVRIGRVMQTLFTNLPENTVPSRSEEVGYGIVVADGMGGREGGEIASSLAIQTVIAEALQIPDWILRPEGAFAELVMVRAADRHRRVPGVLAERAKEHPQLQNMGTTLTVACSIGWQLFVAHVGDSRVYLFRQGELHQLTTDHTLAQEMANEGRIAPREVARHRLRHVLTRVLGAEGHDPEPEVQRLGLAGGDCLLVCTDGLTEMVPEEQITAVLAEPATAAQRTERLVELALEHGGKDNVTAVVAQYRVAHAAEPVR